MIHINFSLKVSRAASAPPHLVSGVFTVAISGDLGTPWRSESWCLADLANLANLSPPALPSSIILNTRNINFINTDKCLNFESKYLLDTEQQSEEQQHSYATFYRELASVSSVCPDPGHAVTSAMTTNLWWC